MRRREAARLEKARMTTRNSAGDAVLWTRRVMPRSMSGNAPSIFFSPPSGPFSSSARGTGFLQSFVLYSYDVGYINRPFFHALIHPGQRRENE